MLGSLQALFHSKFIAAPWGRCYYYPSLTDEETGLESLFVFCFFLESPPELELKSRHSDYTDYNLHLLNIYRFNERINKQVCIWHSYDLIILKFIWVR